MNDTVKIKIWECTHPEEITFEYTLDNQPHVTSNDFGWGWAETEKGGSSLVWVGQKTQEKTGDAMPIKNGRGFWKPIEFYVSQETEEWSLSKIEKAIQPTSLHSPLPRQVIKTYWNAFQNTHSLEKGRDAHGFGDTLPDGTIFKKEDKTAVLRFRTMIKPELRQTKCDNVYLGINSIIRHDNAEIELIPSAGTFLGITYAPEPQTLSLKSFMKGYYDEKQHLQNLTEKLQILSPHFSKIAPDIRKVQKDLEHLKRMKEETLEFRILDAIESTIPVIEEGIVQKIRSLIKQ